MHGPHASEAPLQIIRCFLGKGCLPKVSICLLLLCCYWYAQQHGCMPLTSAGFCYHEADCLSNFWQVADGIPDGRST